MAGRSTTGNISFGIALVAGKKRVPNPAAGITALRTDLPIDIGKSYEWIIESANPEGKISARPTKKSLAPGAKRDRRQVGADLLSGASCTR
jgi:hypothetical protein